MFPVLYIYIYFIPIFPIRKEILFKNKESIAIFLSSAVYTEISWKNKTNEKRCETRWLKRKKERKKEINAKQCLWSSGYYATLVN